MELANLANYNLSSNAKLTALSFKDEDDWLTLRQKGIGGSDIGAVMGLNKYSSPLKVYKQKVEGYKEDLSDNVNVKKGKDLENFILTNYVQPHMSKLGYSVEKPDFMLINSDYPYFRANLDGLAHPVSSSDYTENIVTEIKYVSEYAEVNWNGKDYCGVPPYYYAQVQLYLLVTGASSGIVCALFDSDWDVHYFSIPRDEAFIAKMIKAGSEFYQFHMLMKIPPRLTYELDKEDVIKTAKNLKETPTTYTPSKEMNDYIEKYVSNAAKLKDAEAIQNKLKDLILDLHTKGCVPTDSKHKVSLSVTKTNRFNQTKFKTDHEDMYNEYCEESESPRFTVK